MGTPELCGLACGYGGEGGQFEGGEEGEGKGQGRGRRGSGKGEGQGRWGLRIVGRVYLAGGHWLGLFKSLEGVFGVGIHPPEINLEMGCSIEISLSCRTSFLAENRTATKSRVRMTC